MAETIAVDWAATMTVRQTLDTTTQMPAGTSGSGGTVLTHDAWNNTASMSATAGNGVAETVTKFVAIKQAMTAGAATIDLTSLSGTMATTVTFSGLKVQAVYLRNPSTNANNITIVPGASNGYNLFGASSSITLAPGQELLWRGYDACIGGDVGSSAKNIDISGTTTQTLWIAMAAG